MNAKLTQQKETIWQATQERLADGSGLAVVVVDEESADLLESNNNSICAVLYNSEEFAPECRKFCGKAREMATSAGKSVEYKCHAGLNCLAVPVKTESKTLVAIVGRVFLKAEDYRNATTRAISGDWQKFPPTKFFENVLLTGSIRNLEATAKQLENLEAKEKNALEHTVEKFQTIAKTKNRNKETGNVKTLQDLVGEETEKQPANIKDSSQAQTAEDAELVEQLQNTTDESAAVSEKLIRRNSEKLTEASQWRSLLGSLLKLTYRQACESILSFISKRYATTSLAWLERKGNRFEAVFASGGLQAQQMQLSVSADDERLLEALRREIPLELHERQNAEEIFAPQTVNLFPIAIGGEIRSAIMVGDEISSEKTKRRIARFCRTVASQLEILRLREQLTKRGWLERAVQKFNESVRDVETDDFWASLAQISAELMRAERCSLLVFDEKSNRLTAKAATGAFADIIKKEEENLGERIALKVMQTGKPLVVGDIRKIDIAVAPIERPYKTNSFISCPITIGKRKIGVLNVTDRAGGESYSEVDLEILNAIMPQLAVSIDRALLKRKAGEFEQLSVTDPLTGLRNRRYLEARLAEEIKRSKRDKLHMSFMMIDVDYFKSYNDNFSHPEGDKALRLVAQCLKETLRGADIAARYGGEEFTILLPQTTSEVAETIGERLRARVATTMFPNRQVTISVGVASCSDDVCSAEKIIKAADDAVYEAKRQGRNNVQVFEKLHINDGER